MKRLILSSILAISILGFFHSETKAAVLSAYPAQMQSAPGETFIVDVRLNSEKEVINAVETQLSYPPDLLEVVDISRGGSFLTLWPEVPSADKSNGTISILGGIPNGSLVIDGRVLSVTFRAKSLGNAAVKFLQDRSNVYLNDGKGSTVSLAFVSGDYRIQNPSPYAIDVSSPTHPDEHVWSKLPALSLEWETTEGTLYSYDLVRDPQKELDEIPEQTDGKATFPNLSDGIYYFLIKEKRSNDAWGPVTQRRIMIDQTSPENFIATVSKDDSAFEGKYFLTFATRDLSSGIAQYNVREGDRLYQDVTSPYILKAQDLTGAIRIIALDKAGNSTEFLIPANPQKNEKNLITLSVLPVLLGAFILLAITGLFLIIHKRKSLL